MEAHAKLFQKGVIPAKTVLLLAGTLREKNPKRPKVVASGTLVGFHHMLAEQPMESDFVATSKLWVLELTRDAFEDALASIPSLAVSLRGPDSVDTIDRRPILTPFVNRCRHRSVPMKTWILDIRKELENMGESVLVVELVPGDASMRRKDGVVTMGVDRLERQGLPKAVRGHLHVLIDTSALPQDVNVLSCAALGCATNRPHGTDPVRAVVLVDHARDWPDLAAQVPLPASRWALPVSVLSARPRPRVSDPLRSVASAVSGLEAFAELDERTHPADHWPVGAVRAVGDDEPPHRTDSSAAHEEGGFGRDTSMARCARALAYRRVGVAIGGSAVLSAAAIPLIQKMQQRNIPIDALSGTSFGTLIGAFYTVLGHAGVDRMLGWMWTFLPMLLSTGSFTSRGIAWWMRQFVGDVELGQIEIPLFPVATDADALTEFDVRSGRVAQAVRVSGSMPPGAPTYRDGRRLIDGGVIADVPCRVLDDEGIDLIVGVSSFAVPKRLPEPNKSFPRLAAWWGTADRHRRFVDFARSYLMLWHYAAYSQADYATVMYTAETFGYSGLDYAAAARIVRAAARSEALETALDEVQGSWDSLNPRISPHLVDAEAGTDDAGLDRDLEQIADVARTQRVRVWVALDADDEGAGGSGTAAQRIRRIRKQLVELGVPSKNLSVRRRAPGPDDPDGTIRYTASAR